MRMFAARRAKSAGSRLHMRLSRVFAIVALIPTVLVAVFAVVTLSIGVEGWFSKNVQNVVKYKICMFVLKYCNVQGAGLSKNLFVHPLNSLKSIRKEKKILFLIPDFQFSKISQTFKLPEVLVLNK